LEVDCFFFYSFREEEIISRKGMLSRAKKGFGLCWHFASVELAWCSLL